MGGVTVVECQHDAQVRHHTGRQSLARTGHRPRAVHAQVAVQGHGRGVAEGTQPGEQVLAVGVVLHHGPAGDVARRQTWHPEVGAHDAAADQLAVQPAGELPDAVSLRHVTILPPGCLPHGRVEP